MRHFEAWERDRCGAIDRAAQIVCGARIWAAGFWRSRGAGWEERLPAERSILSLAVSCIPIVVALAAAVIETALGGVGRATPMLLRRAHSCSRACWPRGWLRWCSWFGGW